MKLRAPRCSDGIWPGSMSAFSSSAPPPAANDVETQAEERCRQWQHQQLQRILLVLVHAKPPCPAQAWSCLSSCNTASTRRMRNTITTKIRAGDVRRDLRLVAHRASQGPRKLTTNVISADLYIQPRYRIDLTRELSSHGKRQRQHNRQAEKYEAPKLVGHRSQESRRTA